MHINLLLRSQNLKYNMLVPAFARVHTCALSWNNIQKLCEVEHKKLIVEYDRDGDLCLAHKVSFKYFSEPKLRYGLLCTSELYLWLCQGSWMSNTKRRILQFSNYSRTRK